MSNSANLELRIPSSTSGTKRRSESLQKHINAPSIQRWYASSKENLHPSSKEKRTGKKRKKTKPAANGTVDNANPVELGANSFKGFIKMDAIHFLDACLNHLLPLQVKLDQHVVSAEVQVNDAGKVDSPLSEVVVSERVDTAMNCQLNIRPQAREEPSLHSDPLQNELEKIQKETGELQKSHQDTMSGLKSECKKEKKELIAAVRKKYELKFENAQAQFQLKKNGAIQDHKKMMHKLSVDAYGSNCLNMWPTWPLMQQGFPSNNSMQYHQHVVRPAPPNLQQISVPHPFWFNPPNFQQNPSFQNSNTHPQNPDIRSYYVPSSNMPQLHSLPVNQINSLEVPYGYYPQGHHQFPSVPTHPCGYYYPQFPLMPSYPYGYLPQEYPFPSHCSLQGLKNFNLAVDSKLYGSKKTRIYDAAEPYTSSINSEPSAVNNDDETERVPQMFS